MPADLIAYALVLGMLLIGAALLFTDPSPLVGRVRAFLSATHVELLTLPAVRPLCERFDYPSGDEGVYAIHWEMHLWLGIVAGLADLAAVTPQIEAAYLPVGVTR